MLKLIDRQTLTEAVSRAKIYKQIEATEILDYTWLLLVGLWGERVRRRIKLRHLKNNQLVVSAGSTVLAGELKLHQEFLIRKINDKFGPGAIRGFRIEL